MISIEEARRLVKPTSKYQHVLLVAAILQIIAVKLGENKLEWELTGLLHDLDFDDTKNDRRNHGILAAKRLEGKDSCKVIGCYQVT